jgi:fructokinase
MRIGIDLGGTKIEAIALSNTGEELYRERVPTPKDSYPETLRAIKYMVSKVESSVGVADSIGLGIPGTLSSISNKVKNANATWLNYKTLDEDVQQILGRPVRIANDANCFAVSESIDGAGAGYKMVFGVIIGTGCGGGISIDGKAHIGNNGVAGEWGHNPLPWPNDEDIYYQKKFPCYCSRIGCVETFLSGPGFARDYELHTGKVLEAYQIVKLVEKGESNAELCLVRYEQRLGKALASLINTLDPDVIVLGGGMSNIERLYSNLKPLLSKWVFGKECATEVRQAKYGDSSGVRGAAWLW